MEAMDPALSLLQFNVGNRWSSTATNGDGLGQGDPTTITWSIVPDGTVLPFGTAGAGEPAANSALIDRLDSIYGDTPGPDLTSRSWFPHFTQIFDRWEQISGNTYVYEANDDGNPISNSGSDNPGVLGVRGDVRIGGHLIDGNSGILAYNYFPINGDMVIDTADNFYENLTGNSLGLRNVLAHEHGHGLGINHVCPVNQTKLMEPFISFAFDGPQHDDILAVNRGYGDRFEHNDSNAAPTNLGAPGFTTVQLNNISIDDNSDEDWYSFTVAENTQLDATLNPIGATYLNGPQNSNGSCSPGTLFNSLVINDLGIEILDPNGTTVIAVANGNPAGVSESLFNVPMLSAGTYFARVFGGTANNVQLYELLLTLEAFDPNAPPANDSCANAICLADGSVVDGTTTNAGGTDITSCATGDTADVWYAYTPCATENVTVSLCGSPFNTTLAIFDSCSGLEVACNDDSCGTQSEITTTLNAGPTYLIRVSGANGETGNFTLSLTGGSGGCGECIPTPPPNDNCSDAICILDGVAVNGTTAHATGADITSCTANDSADVWYSFTPTVTGSVTVSLCGSTYDTALAVFDSCGGLELACNDDSCALQSAVSLALTAGTTYLIRISGFDGDTGDFILQVIGGQGTCGGSCDLPAPPSGPLPPDSATGVDPLHTTETSWNNAPPSGYSQSSPAPPVASSYPDEPYAAGSTGTDVRVTHHAGGVAYQDSDLDEEGKVPRTGHASSALPVLGDVISSFASPGTGPFGLTWRDGFLYHADTDTDLVYQLNPADGAVVTTIGPFNVIGGLAWDGSQFWATDAGADTIFRFDDSGAVLETFPAPGRGPVGITWDGASLWICDWQTDTIYQVNPTNGALQLSFAAPDTRVAGMAFDGSALWVNGRDSGTTYQISPANGSVLSSFATPPTPGNPNGRGLAFDGQFLWLVNGDTDAILQIDVEGTGTNPDGCLLTNGDFETGDFTGWTILNSGSGTYIINDGTVDPYSSDGPLAPCQGNFSAMTDQRGPGGHTLYQDVTIPATATSATLNWSDMIRNHAGTFANPIQQFRVEIRNPANNAVLDTLFQTNPGDPLLTGCNARSADVSAFIGQTIRIAFAEADNLFFFNAHVDDVCLNVALCPTTYDVLLDTVNPPQTMICSDVADPNCTLPAPLSNCETHYWQVIAKNPDGQRPGPVWSFTTSAIADFTGECEVNYVDFSILHAGWSNVPCSEANGWCNGVDINRDGVVDILELALMAEHWL
jgi:hypothetical protein